MQKGHLILGTIVLLLMLILPVAAVTGEGGDPVVSSVSSQTPASAASEAALQVFRSDTGVVETVPVRDYIFGVVAAEMPQTYPAEAVKAQAVAAYTLALYRTRERQASPSSALGGADVSDDSGTDQAYITREVARAKWGAYADAYEKQLDQWIDAVWGQYVAYQDAPAMTVYHGISAGRTESAQTVWGGAVPYLVPVESVGDLMSDGYITEKTVSKADFVQTLTALEPSLAGEPSAEQAVGAIKRSDSGTVLTAELFGTAFTGQALRSAFGLRSANFDLAVQGDAVVFTVRGYGHLVGMSQYGARTMAEQGSTWQEILLWYYPGCTVVQTASPAQ